MYDQGVRAEMGGLQLDAEGRPVVTSITDRMIAFDAELLRRVPDVIAIAYGVDKAGAVRAALRGAFVKSLVTHTAMARRLLEEV
jgi:DNA-binding transcriptional regulator LsrR (DeoR family)